MKDICHTIGTKLKGLNCVYVLYSVGDYSLDYYSYYLSKDVLERRIRGW